MARGVNGMWPLGRLLALADDLLDLGAHGLQRDVEALERLGGDALALVDEAEQDVLGADVVVGEHAGLFLGQHDHPPGSVGEPLEHAHRSPEASSRLAPAAGTDGIVRTAPTPPHSLRVPARARQSRSAESEHDAATRRDDARRPAPSGRRRVCSWRPRRPRGRRRGPGRGRGPRSRWSGPSRGSRWRWGRRRAAAGLAATAAARRATLRAWPTYGASASRSLAAFLSFRSISYVVPSRPKDTVSVASLPSRSSTRTMFTFCAIALPSSCNRRNDISGSTHRQQSCRRIHRSDSDSTELQRNRESQVFARRRPARGRAGSATGRGR